MKRKQEDTGICLAMNNSYNLAELVVVSGMQKRVKQEYII
ncbi:hypothetical protein SpAn4DRAFT_1476 [Sporomusa ovata]|uniref:Uncharacterized protein n=1 Tax=Sporomusa ovata TaxID=2378 RepID=A0A0U1KSY7_9FIRM|nr:hypothetical protein SpAn4DRAFT_1476 [Sporomusa ovata]